MPWTAPATHTTGELVTAASINTEIRDNTNYLHETHGPIWIPSQDWEGAGGPSQLGTNPNALNVMLFSSVADQYARHTAMVPDVWISGRLTAKIFFTVTLTEAGKNMRWSLNTMMAGDTGSLTTSVGAEDLGVTVATPATEVLKVATLGLTVDPVVAINRVMRLNLARLATHVADDYTAGTAGFVGLRLEFV